MFEGGCFCGNVRYLASGKVYDESNCHCSICRRLSAAAFVSWFSVAKDDFRFTRGEPATLASSDHGRRTFCRDCGTPLTFVTQQAPDTVDVTTCSLDDPASLPPKEQIHMASRPAWMADYHHLPGRQ